MSAMRSSAIMIVLVVAELLADEALRLALVRRHEERLGLDSVAERLALRVEHCRHVSAVQIANRVGVERSR